MTDSSEFISGIEFWCVVLKPGEKRCIRSAHKLDLIHITMACVADENPKGRTMIECGANGSKGPICVLTKKQQNQTLSLVLPGAENIYLEAKGTDSVSITGFLQPMLPVEGDPIQRLHRWDPEIDQTYDEIYQSMANDIFQGEVDQTPRRFKEGDAVEVFDSGKWIPAKVCAVNYPIQQMFVPYLVLVGNNSRNLIMVDSDSDSLIRERKKSAPVKVKVPKIPKEQPKAKPDTPKEKKRPETSPTTPEANSAKSKKEATSTSKRKLLSDNTPPPKRRKKWNDCLTGVKWKKESIPKSKLVDEKGYRFLVLKNDEPISGRMKSPVQDKLPGTYGFLSEHRRFQETLQIVQLRKPNRIKMKYVEGINKYRCILDAT